MHPVQYMMMILLAAPLAQWKPAGDAAAVAIQENGAIVLSAREPTTAGAASPLRRSPPGADAVLVTATVENAAAGSLVFSIHDEAGETIGYWVNPIDIGAKSPIAAVIPLHRRTQQLRLFSGTHAAASQARIEAIEWNSVRMGMHYRSTQYGALIDAQHTQGQTFRATGSTLAAVTLQVRQMQPAEQGDLRVRLFAIEGSDSADLATARQKPPLVERTLSRRLLPPAQEDAAQTLAVPLPARVKRGGMYLIEFSCDSEQGLLMWAGPGGYADGMRVENDNLVPDWDLHLAIYYAN